jgi:hypothetical protein
MARPIAHPRPDPAVVLTKSLLRAAGLLDIPAGTLARILGVSEASVSRLASGARHVDPASKEGELALLLIRLYRSLDALVGADSAQRKAWMDSYNHPLNGRPIELIERAQGLATVVSYLDAMRAPV